MGYLRWDMASAPMVVETTWRRGWNDFYKHSLTHPLFVVLQVVMAPTLGLVAVYDPIVAVIVGMGIVVTELVGLWIGATVSAPEKHRRELRQMYKHTAAAQFGAGYERYISMVMSGLEPYLSQPPSGNARIRHEIGRIAIEGDDGRISVLGIEPPGNVYSR